jgi:hypothetical protein
MIPDSGDLILLTGAGFTANFGAPVASELWSLLFAQPSIASSPRLHELALQNFNVEDLYQDVMDGDYTRDEKAAFEEAISGLYREVDETVRAYRDGPGTPESHKVREFVATFGRATRPNFVFTLNQDLFFERHYYNAPPYPDLTLPGLGPHRQEWFSPHYKGALDASSTVVLPTAQAVAADTRQPLNPGFFCLKLHGSQNWRDSSGHHRMVIGTRKADFIRSEPLLRWYFEVFREVLLSRRHRILVIGYGFGDSHVNDVLAEAAANGKLELVILDIRQPEDFHEHVINAEPDSDRRVQNQAIWKCLAAYFPDRLADLFPQQMYGDETPSWRRLKALIRQPVAS